MKKIFFLILSFFSLTDSYAQNGDGVYYLKNSGYLVSTKDSADFTLKITTSEKKADQGSFVVQAFYPDGQVKYIGSSKTDKLTAIHKDFKGFFKPVLDGPYTDFFADGHKKSMATYIDGELNGEETDFYPNGKLHSIKDHTKDGKIFYKECRDSIGNVRVVDGNGKGLEFLFNDFKSFLEGNVANGIAQGVWTGKQADTINTIGEYKNGILLNLARIDASGIKTYIKLEVVPQYKGGINAFYAFLGHNIRYPVYAFTHNIQGKVIISFVVEKDGTLADFKIQKSVNNLIDDEAVRVLKKSPPWTPGMVNNEPVRVAYSVPISFALSGK